MTELRDGLAAIGVFPTSEELDLFMTRYDDGGDRHLNMREFGEAFLPLDAYYAGMVNRRGSNHIYPVYRRDDCLRPDTQLNFCAVWRTHLDSRFPLKLSVRDSSVCPTSTSMRLSTPSTRMVQEPSLAKNSSA